MNSYRTVYPFVLLLLLTGIHCKNKIKDTPKIDIVATPEQLEEKIPVHIKELIDRAGSDSGYIGDSVYLHYPAYVKTVYAGNENKAIWSSRESWSSLGDSLLVFIKEARLYGLFPEDYHFKSIEAAWQKILADTAGKRDRKDAVLWSKADVLLTDGLFQVLKDISLGRLQRDSITLRKDSVLGEDFFVQQMNILRNYGSVNKLVRFLEPRHPGYILLKAGIRQFLDSADFSEHSFVPSPKSEPIAFKKALQKRLYEEGFIGYDSIMADSVMLSEAVKKFQRKKSITVDGKAGEGTVRMLNLSDREKFIRIAISLDKYKQLPEKMPGKYIWVNLPGYYLQLKEADTIRIISKIICGKPITRTPLLTSAVSEMITYPQWTVPASIIKKEILPAIKKNTDYLAKRGFSLVDKDGNEVQPDSVDWSKYKTGIPYKVVQGSGDANALGVLKFNFNNKYAVYLHDTNQRHLFGNANRALSHGCVRVQNWEELALYILKNDKVSPGITTEERIDSLKAWLERKEKRSISVRERIPLFIRYFTAEAGEDGIVFYDDIYGEDGLLRQKYFPGK
jgi:L,D-transpeptidase YcbB